MKEVKKKLHKAPFFSNFFLSCLALVLVLKKEDEETLLGVTLSKRNMKGFRGVKV